MKVLLGVLSMALVALAACGGSSPGGSASRSSNLKVAMILPGPVQDADYNAVGYQALQEIKARTGAQVAFSENVAVADAERVAREYISGGSNVIAFHGGQFVTIVTKLATQFPKVSFIEESSGRQANLPPNVWNIGRKFYQGFYVLGVLAAAATRTGRIGYIAGVKLPDFVASLNAVKLAVQRTNPQAKVLYDFTGDQNDQVKARETAAAEIGQGVDFIIVSVNNGVYGIVQAAEATQGHPVLVTSYYTDKSKAAPKVFTASLLSDFSSVYLKVVEAIRSGTRGGYLEMRPGSGFALSPIENVPPEAAQKANQAFQQVVQNQVDIPEITDRIT
jgi:basic membrane protein A